MALPIASLASPGGLNADGCHVCHTNCQKYGLKDEEYHCHTIIKPALKNEIPVSSEEKGLSYNVLTILVLCGIFTIGVAAFLIGKASVKRH